MPTFELNLLGGFDLRDPTGNPVPLTSKKARALLAYLAMSATPTVPRPKIAALLWGDRGDEQARGSLRQTLSLLRKAFGDPAGEIVISAPEGLAINKEKLRIDVTGFEAEASGSRREQLERAMALYRGPLLDGVEVRDAVFEDWLRDERERLAEIAARAALALFELCETAGDDEAALSLTGKLLTIDPMREDVHRAAMRLHQKRGRWNEALRQYQECETVLDAELGIAPQDETRALYEEILAHREQGEHQPVVPAAGLSSQSKSVEDRPEEDRPSIAVLPFAELGAGEERGGLGDAFAHDTIVELSRRRWLTVIARGSTFQFLSAPADIADIGRVLNARYALTGSCQAAGDTLRVTSQLAECATGHVVWADSFERPYREIFALRRTISEQIAAHASQEIEQVEIIRARDLEPADLGAWARYHRGLWHAFRFNAKDNEAAHQLFATAVEDDPTFSSAYAALSFTHFQRAFLQYSSGTEAEIRTALNLAEQSLDLDPRNPQAHYAYGRACLLDKNIAASIEALKTSVQLEPSFAHGHYSLGMVQAQAGDPNDAIRNVQHAAKLSPIDPLQFAMESVQAFSEIRLGNYDEAVQHVVRSAAKPNAHVQAYATAAAACMLAGREAEARRYADDIRKRNPDYSINNFLIAFPNFNAQDRETIVAPLRDLGFE